MQGTHLTISFEQLEPLYGNITVLNQSLLRASFCKYRESSDSFKIFNFFIFCPNKAFSELFSKIQLNDPKPLEFFQNRGKFENRHFGLPPPLKIDKNSAVVRPNGQLRQAAPPPRNFELSLSEMRFAAFSAFSVLIRRKFWLYIYIF